MQEVSVRLFGSPSIERAGQRVEVDTRKAIALLAYLAVAGRPVGRAVLAALLWPEYDATRAAANFRRTLWSLNTALGEGMLDVDQDSVALRAHPDLHIDVVAFRRHAANVHGHSHPSAEPCAACYAELVSAAELARGDFLEGFTLRDAVEFDDWQSLTASSLRRELGELLHRLVHAHLAAGRTDAACASAERWSALDPLDQAAASQLMLCYAWTNRHAAALHLYRELERRLISELGAGPDEEVTALFAAIKAHREPPPPAGAGKNAGASLAALPAEEAAEEAADASQAAAGDPAKQPDLPAFLLAPERPAPLFVARREELAALDQHLRSAMQGSGRIVFVAGEAGQGKTTLLNAFMRRACAEHPELVAAFGACNAYTGIGDPYLPFRELLDLLTGDVDAVAAAGSLPHAAARRLWQIMPATVAQILKHGPDLLDTLVALSPLLARSRAYLPAAVRTGLEQRAARPSLFDPMLQQASLFEQLTRVLMELAQRKPLLLVLDDLQWADAGSLALLFHLSRRLQNARVLLLGAYRASDVAMGRQGERHPLLPIVHEVAQVQGASQIDLGRAEDRAFVDALLDSEPNRLDQAFRRELLRQTGGHPLFTTELLRGMQEHGDLVRDEVGRWVARPALNWDKLPARVEAVIGERVGRLPTALRELLRAASVEGEEFSAEVAARLAGMDEAEARRRLSGELDREHRLVRAIGVERVAAGRLTRYRFHHFLIQRSLYSSLDPAERMSYHEDAALLLEHSYAGRTAEIAVALAQHFAAAGLGERAVHYYQQAGDRALRLSANVEAADHFGRALQLLGELPPSAEHQQLEFVLQASYSMPVQHLEGWGSERGDAAIERALALARSFGSPPATHPLLGRIAHVWVYRGELQRALALAQELLALAEAEEDDAVLLEAHTVVGLTQFYMGHFAEAQPHLDLAWQLYDPAAHAHLTYLYGQDAGVHVGLYRMLNLTMLGYVDQARAQAAETLSLAEQIGHPFTLAFAWSFAALAGALALDVEQVQAASQMALAVAYEHSFPTWISLGLMGRGFVRAHRGEVDQGFADAFEGLQIALTTGAQVLVAFLVGLTSDMYCMLGQADDALSMLDITLALAEHNAEGMAFGDLHRRRAEVLFALGHSWAEVDAELRRAIDDAHAREARLHELRALTARLRLVRVQSPAEAPAAHAALAVAYAWFSEGFAAPDLAAARAELARTDSADD